MDLDTFRKKLARQLRKRYPGEVIAPWCTHTFHGTTKVIAFTFDTSLREGAVAVPRIELNSRLVRRVPSSPELSEALSTKLAFLPFGRVYGKTDRDGTIELTLVHSMLTEYCDVKALAVFFDTFAAYARRLSDELHEAFSGTQVGID